MLRSTFTYLVLAGLGLTALSGCKQIEMKDGSIPDAFVTQARQTEGTYKGFIQFNDSSGISKNLREATMTLKIVGNKPVLTVTPDFLGDGCGSTLGPLLNVQVSGLTLKRAAFAFDGGSCKTPDLSDRMMINISREPTGKFKLFTWVMVGTTEIATDKGTESASTMSMAHFTQQ